MITLRETVAGLTGAWRLARLDPQGMGVFDTTEKGFWRSFYAAALGAPAYVLLMIWGYEQDPVLGSVERIVAIDAIAYVIDWTAFPLAMAWAVRRFERERFYVRYIVAQNWANLLALVLFLITVGLAETDIPWLTHLPAFAIIAVLAYQWFVARTALMLSGAQAFAVVGLDVLIDLAVSLVVRVMLPAAS